MKFWILIPSYLWKNTYKRWLENLISPATKIITTFLLALFTLFILGYFVQSRSELETRLKKSSAFEVKFTETLSYNDSLQRISIIHDEEILWKQEYGKDKIQSFFQILGNGQNINGKNIPVIVYKEAIGDLPLYQEGAPVIWLMSNEHYQLEKYSKITVQRKELIAKPAPIPKDISKLLRSDSVIAIPFEAALPFLRNGGINHTIAKFSSSNEVKSFMKTAQAYYNAERRLVYFQSSQTLLEQLQQLSLINDKIRAILILFCGGMLSLISGSITWLEFRHEIYLISLLRSFGVSKYIIVLHSIAENLVLISIGLFAAIHQWQQIYTQLTKHLPIQTDAATLELSQANLQTLLYFALLGIILSVLPILIGLKKQPGLILQ